MVPHILPVLTLVHQKEGVVGNDSTVLQFTVEVSKDRLQAWILPTVPDDPRPVSRENILVSLEEANIALNDSVDARIDAYLSLKNGSDETDGSNDVDDYSERFLIAEGALPVEGSDGGFDLIDDVVDPSASEDDDEQEEEDAARIDFHSFNTIVTVEQDQVVGKITKAVLGMPGCDVHGNAIEPKKTVRFVDLDSTVRCSDENPLLVVANTSGKVVFKDLVVKIDEVVKINGDVDYECGNIKASTDVVIHGTILDEFEVISERSINVCGAIQAAKVEAGEDLIVNGGIISRHKAAVRAGGQIFLKFGSESKMTAGGDIQVTKELMNCQVHSEGVCRVLRGDVIGGEVYAKIGLESRAIGSEACVPTNIIVGVHPSVLAEEEAEMKKSKERLKAAEQIRTAVKPLMDNLKRLTPAQRERATELLFTAETMTTEAGEAELKREELIEQEIEGQKSYVLVGKVIYPGARIRIGRRQVVFDQELMGPVRIEYRKVKRVTEMVAVSQTSGSVTVLKSRDVVDEEDVAPQANGEGNSLG